MISVSTILVNEYSTEAMRTMRSTVGTITATSEARSGEMTNTVTVYPAEEDSTSVPKSSAMPTASASVVQESSVEPSSAASEVPE